MFVEEIHVALSVPEPAVKHKGFMRKYVYNFVGYDSISATSITPKIIAAVAKRVYFSR